METPPWGKYTELRPDALAAIRAAIPVAYLPWGALEWHGPHLPLGLDGLVAETVAERTVRRTGGVLLPTTWWPVATLPHTTSLSVRSDIVCQLWEGIFSGLSQAGWQIIVLISGHYTPGHELALMEVAQQAMKTHPGLLVLALPPLALVDEEMLDHGALWQTSLLLALRANLVDLDLLGTGALHPADSGVLGRDPRGLASASLGHTTLELAVERITNAVEQLRREGTTASLRAFYERRRTRYHSYLERYEQIPLDAATTAWWEELIALNGVGRKSQDGAAKVVDGEPKSGNHEPGMDPRPVKAKEQGASPASHHTKSIISDS